MMRCAFVVVALLRPGSKVLVPVLIWLLEQFFFVGFSDLTLGIAIAQVTRELVALVVRSFTSTPETRFESPFSSYPLCKNSKANNS